MDKIIVLEVLEDDEKILLFKNCLQSTKNYSNISISRDMRLSFPRLEIDLYHREVKIEENIIRFTDLEFRILLYLAKQPGRVFTYQQIYEGVWGEEYIYEKGIIMSHIRHIRQKLESGGSSFDYIENIRGVGYRFKKPMTDSS